MADAVEVLVVLTYFRISFILLFPLWALYLCVWREAG